MAPYFASRYSWKHSVTSTSQNNSLKIYIRDGYQLLRHVLFNRIHGIFGFAKSHNEAKLHFSVTDIRKRCDVLKKQTYCMNVSHCENNPHRSVISPPPSP